MKKGVVRLLFLSFSLCACLLIYCFQKSAYGENGYAGVDVCRSCHEDHYLSYMSSIHGKKSIPGSPAKRDACESCHGSGSDHVLNGGGKGIGGIQAFGKKGDSRAKAARCLSCHEETRQLSFWNMGSHKKNDVSCDNCHTIHTKGGNNIKTEEKDLCYRCHQDIKAQFGKQSRHPVNEGLIKCSDCHDVHGSFGSKMIKASKVNELCFNCHAEKRGPFFRQHSPVRESCLNCHEAHGSNHLRLLVRKVPQLCQSCHDVAGEHPSRPYTALNSFNGPGTFRNKMFSRACLNCHTNIHGTNAVGENGKRFLR